MNNSGDLGSEKKDYLKLEIDRIIFLGYYGQNLDLMSIMLRKKTNVEANYFDDVPTAITRYRIATRTGERVLWFTNLNTQFNDLFMHLDQGEEAVDVIRLYESKKKLRPSYVVACSSDLDSYTFVKTVENHNFNESMGFWGFAGDHGLEDILLKASNHFKAI